MIGSAIQIALKLALAFLDRWMNQRIAQWPTDQPTKERVAALEAELVAFLGKIAESDAAKAFVRALARDLIAMKFPNDPTTGNWA